MRNGVPGVTQVLCRFPPDVAHRLALDFAPLRRVREARRLSASALRRRQCSADERLHVVRADPTGRASALNAANVHTELAGKPTDRRRGGDRRTLRFSGLGESRTELRRLPLASARLA